MKEFIYLDTAFLHSFIAQENNGLPTTSSSEYQESETKSNQTGKNNQLVNEGQVEASSGEFNIPHILSTPSGKLKYKLGNIRTTNSSISLTQLEAGKEIISKQLHDDALNQFEDYLNKNNLLVVAGNKSEPGDFILIKGRFTIFDIDHLSDVMDPEKISFGIELAAHAQLQTLLQVAATTNDNKIKNHIRSEQEKLKSQSKDMKKSLEQVSGVLSYLKNVLPNSSFLRIGSFIAPLKQEHLRESSKELVFKYGKSSLEITLLGKFTKIFDNFINTEDSTKESPIGGIVSFLESFDELFSSMGILKKGDKIISPIAIYFE
ncbi:hypothetical protein H7B90_00925 [Cohnella xylanilytica]|uniref:Uncharacterized protein n=1 Tax=Cohnella xylanilytica TaxID=557555 RepID=A0A841TP76_9BACL|nr:hypothetical protein [Cohnella xylanilytica]MBB6689955.1 hypothetical protein [Cohnella xylanilytica]